MQNQLYSHQVFSIFEKLGMKSSLNFTAAGKILLMYPEKDSPVELDIDQLQHITTIYCVDNLIYVYKIVGFSNFTAAVEVVF